MQKQVRRRRPAYNKNHRKADAARVFEQSVGAKYSRMRSHV